MNTYREQMKALKEEGKKMLWHTVGCKISQLRGIEGEIVQEMPHYMKTCDCQKNEQDKNMKYLIDRAAELGGKHVIERLEDTPACEDVTHCQCGGSFSLRAARSALEDIIKNN